MPSICKNLPGFVAFFLGKLVKKNLPKKFVLCAIIAVLPYSLAHARLPIMLGLGDSISEGVQSADASFRTQPFNYLNLIRKQIGLRFPLPLIKSGPLGVIEDASHRNRIFPFSASANLAVSGADVNSLLNDRADALNEEAIDSETDLVLFPRLGSQIEIAESVGSPFVVCWIGNNDVLSAAISFNQLNASQMTAVKDFETDFNEIKERLIKSGEIIVFANIPDVTNIGFLVDSRDLIRFLGSDFGLGEGNYTSIVVMFLIRLGLDDGSLLQDPDFVLDGEEVGIIRERIRVFNDIIGKAADGIGMPVVDINTLLHEVAARPPVFLGIPITPRFLGGLFSLDGVHPSNIGHAVIANAFIEAINSCFNVCVPSINQEDLREIFLKDPFVDKDDDGKVRGRAGAGMLETLSPFLGISGDKNDFIPEKFPNRFDSRLRRRFIKQFLSLKGKDPGMASEWKKQDAVSAFREIFGLTIFHNRE